jgi:hypothetical protein
MSESAREDETPWAQVQRIRAQGGSVDFIVDALEARGLGREDIELLLQDDPAFVEWKRSAPRPATPSAVTAAAPTRPPHDWGRTLRWSVITLSSLLAGIAAAGVRGFTGLVAMMVAWVPSLALVALELRRGPRRTLRSLGFVLFFSFILPTVAAIISGFDAPRTLAVALFASSIPLLIWASRTGERLRGLSDFGGGAVFERADVQFSVTSTAGSVALGDYAEVQVLAQNCVDAPRSLVVMVLGDSASSAPQQRQVLPISPGCVIRVVLPVRVMPSASGRFAFLVDFDVEGEIAGRRVRLAKGHEWVPPSRSIVENLLGVATLATAGIGVFRLGWNGVVRVTIDEQKAPQSTTRSVEVSELYRPDETEVAAAAKS